ncbi:glycosyltransferase family 4 protein [Bacteroidales bacterium]|nr:glycosyltransferase family 4 protein [Bacteroidales bacterium]
MSNRIKIGIVTRRDATDKREWSGTLYSMTQTLEKHVGDVYSLGPYNPKGLNFLLKAIRKISKWVFNKNYMILYNWFLAKRYKKFFEKKISEQKPDIIVAISSAVEMSMLNVDIPIIYVGDTTLKLLRNYYEPFSNLSKFSILESELIERLCFKNSKSLVFSSTWAYDSAISDYKVDEKKIHLIPYGANFVNLPKTEDIINKPVDDVCNLFFIGVDWVRKGGELAYQTFIELKKMGLKVHFTVIGTLIPNDYPKDDTTEIKFLDKNDPEQAKTLYDIFMNTNFLIVPTRADCTPIVFNEANAFGIPVISTNTGGIASVITNNVNGYIFELSDSPKLYAQKIHELYSDTEKYKKLVLSSRKEYDTRLNWDNWGRNMKTIVEDLL